jgi:putative phosphoribosyl transferase
MLTDQVKRGRATMKERRFRNRVEAGQRLASRLTVYANRPDVLVMALPRGGVPVAYEVAKALHAPLDVIIVRKLGVPGQEELAMGAIASGGVCILNDDVVRMLAVPEKMINTVVAYERHELERREHLYRGNRPAYEVHGRTIIIVDDGMATGATMRAAIAAMKQQQPIRIIIAVPVAASATCDELAAQGDEVVCVFRQENFHAVGFWYTHFSQTTDEEVIDLLEQAARERRTRGTESLEQRTRAMPPIQHRSRCTGSSSHTDRGAKEDPQHSPHVIC